MAYQPITTGIVRMTKMRLFPSATNNSIRKYKATILLPKNDTITRQKINIAISDAVGQALQRNWRDISLEEISTPIRDGDGLRNNGSPYGRECADHFMIFASSQTKPDVVDMHFKPINDINEIYNGMYAYTSLTFHPYILGDGKPCIGCALGPVMKIADGAYIPDELNIVHRAFSDIPGLQVPILAPPKIRSNKHPESAPIQKDSVQIEHDSPPAIDENLQSAMDAMKDQKLSISEFKSLVEKHIRDEQPN